MDFLWTKECIVIKDKRLVHVGGGGRHFANSEPKPYCPHCRGETPDGKAEELLIDTIRRVLPPEAAEPAIENYLDHGRFRYGVQEPDGTSTQYILIHRPTRPVIRIHAENGWGKEDEICLIGNMPVADLLAAVLIGLANDGEIPAHLHAGNIFKMGANDPEGRFIRKEFPYDYAKNR